MSRRASGERGVALVEAAFAVPVVMLLLLGCLDLGDWAFQSSQATAAARDGARVGIVHYAAADVTGSSDQTAISQAVAGRLAGQAYSVTIHCVTPTDTTALTNGCGLAVPGCDRISVTVSWTRAPWTFVGAWFGNPTVTGQSVMVIAGAPSTGGTTPTTLNAPNGCAA